MSLSLQLGLRLGLLSGGFTPASLFAAGEQGAWYDPSDFSTMFQTDDTSTPVTAAGQMVGRIQDKSGNGNAAVQANLAARPILRLDAVTGTYYLEFDGTDDRLVCPISVSAQFDRVTALRQISWTNTDQLWSQGSAGLPELRQSSASPGLIIISSGSSMTANNGLAVGTTGIAVETVDGTARSLSLQINNNAPTTNMPASTFGAQTSMSLGARTAGTLAGNFRVYETVVRSGFMTAGQLAALKAYLANRHGVTL